MPAAGSPYCIVCASDLRMLKFAEICGIKSIDAQKTKPMGLGGGRSVGWKRHMEATLTMHGAKYVNMPNPKSNPFTPPGDTRATF